MGLRIGTNLGALEALRNLRNVDRLRSQVMERLATGRQINRASDNPSGLVLLQQLQSQSRTVAQAIENTQAASNLVTTADAALGQIGDLLVGMKADVVASLNTGALGPEQQRALQNSIDQRIAAIDRIAATTRFADQNLLNGSLGFAITNASPELTDVNVATVNALTPFPITVNLNVTAAATQAQAGGSIGAAPQVGDVTFTVRGNLGSQQIRIGDGASQQDVIDAINAVSDFTGVVADAGGTIRSAEVGSDQFVQIQFDAGDLDNVSQGLTYGTDIQAVFNGAAVTGRGNTVTVQNGQLSGQFSVQQGFTGNVSFEIAGGGARFQTGTGVADALRVGFAAAGAATLGKSSGLDTLASLKTGGANSLAVNPGGALSILSAAQIEVSTQRANLGALESKLFESNRRALGVQRENLLASASRLGDLDFAEGITERNRAEVIFQSALGALRVSNFNAEAVLRLLSE
jgi:flagellin-like hook-associated protein FlgL